MTPSDTAFETVEDPTVALARASLVAHVLDCLKSGTTPVTSGERARHAVEIMLAAQTSAREGRVVDLTTTFID